MQSNNINRQQALTALVVLLNKRTRNVVNARGALECIFVDLVICKEFFSFVFRCRETLQMFQYINNESRAALEGFSRGPMEMYWL